MKNKDTYPITRRFIGLALALLVLGSCTIRSSQLDMARAALNRERIGPEHYWQMQLAGQTHRLVAAIDRPPTVSFFAEASDLQIVYDGWNVTHVLEWPERDTSLVIYQQDDMQVHELEDGSIIRMRCGEWTEVRDNLLQLHCESTTGPQWQYTNEIEMNDAGNITRLRFALWPGLSTMELRWMLALDS